MSASARGSASMRAICASSAAGVDAAPARHIGDAPRRHVIGTGDRDALHALFTRLVARVFAIALARLDDAFGLGEAADECDAHHPLASLDSQAHFEPLVGRE